MMAESISKDANQLDRKDLWKKVSKLEREAVSKLTSLSVSNSNISSVGKLSPSSSSTDERDGQQQSTLLDDAVKALATSISLKNQDPFLKLSLLYSEAMSRSDVAESNRLLSEMKKVGLPPHIASLTQVKTSLIDTDVDTKEDVDPGSTFSDTVTEKIRVKVSSFFDAEKSDPSNGKFMFWYKVAIYNEGPEPVQIVARTWEIEKCKGEKEIVRGSGIMSTQPIIPPGDVFSYQSVCPLKV